MYIIHFISTGLLMFFLWMSPANAGAPDKALQDKLGKLFGVSPERVWVECKPDNFWIRQENNEPVLTMCMNKADRDKRCEITIHGLAKAPLKNHISFELNVADTQPRKIWESVLQFHSFPDKGEAWRCPFAALEMHDGEFRMYNRWDASPISKTSGNNCTEAGSSINARTILEDVKIKPGQWQAVQIDTKLSPEDDGEFQVSVDGQQTSLLKGGNTYNDNREPFLKFGMYKPGGWDDGHNLSCVKYRKVKISVE